MTDYSPEMLQSFADRLYRRATWTIAEWTAVGVLLGVVLAGLSASLIHDLTNSSGVIFLVWLVCALGGIAIGREKAFGMKVEAQRLLCQMQIEQNTRPATKQADLSNAGAATSASA